MNGLLVYAPEDAARNQRFIDLCLQAAGSRGMGLTLVYTDELPDAPADFAIMRCRDPRVHESLEHRGVRTFNNSRVAAVANDKLLTYRVLGDHVPMLKTRPLSPNSLPDVYPAVAKPAHGHGGAGVQLVHSPQEALAAARALTDPLWQSAADTARDMRCYVLGGEIVCCMLRESDTDFRSNYSLGGRAVRTEPGEAETALVRRVCELLPLDYAGVDILWKNGNPYLNEIEDPVGARMAYAAGVPMTELLMDYIERTMKGRV